MKKLVLSGLLTILSQTALAETVIGTIDLDQLAPLRQQWQNIHVQKNSQITKEYEQMKAEIKEFQTKIHNNIDKPDSAAGKLKENQIKEIRDKLSKDTLAMSSHLLNYRNQVDTEFRSQFQTWIAEIAKQNHVNVVLPAQVFLFKEGTVDLTSAAMAKLKQELAK